MKRSLLFCLVLAGACGGEPSGLLDGARSFRVTITDGELGAEDARLPFSLAGTVYTLSIAAQPADVIPGVTWVAVRVVPGDVVRVDHCTADGLCAVRTNLPLVDGRAENVQVTVAGSYGSTHLFVEDLGFVPGPVLGSACGNGLDDDGDGRTDYGADSGCAFSNDDSEEGGSHAVGLAQTIFFANPRIADLQGADVGASESPLLGESVLVDLGDLMVTRVSVEGLYVTDISDTRGYNHLYAFNFNTPNGVRVCDRLTQISGIVGEFYGYTELGYPSWTRDPDWTRPERIEDMNATNCPVPEPTRLTPEILQDPRGMESNEAGLVKVEGGVITPRFVDCDQNGNGEIDFDTEEETVCADPCDAALDCTELSNFRNFGQFGVTVPSTSGGDPGKILVVTRDSYPEFDAVAHAGDTLTVVRGTLKQLSFLTIPWILEIRCKDDIVLDGGAAPLPMWQACWTPPEDDDGYSQ